MPVLDRRPHSRYALALLLPLLLPALLPAQQPRPHGAWRLDPTHSDSTAAPFKPGNAPAGPPPGERPGDPGYGPPGAAGPGGGVGGRRFGGGGRYRRAPDDKELARIRQTLELGRQAAARVVIDTESRQFTRIDSDGSEQAYPIGGETITQSIEGAGTVKTKVRWKGDALVVERKVPGGGRVTESYGLGLDGTRMLAFVEVEVGMMQRSYTRRYLPE